MNKSKKQSSNSSKISNLKYFKLNIINKLFLILLKKYNLLIGQFKRQMLIAKKEK